MQQQFAMPRRFAIGQREKVAYVEDKLHDNAAWTAFISWGKMAEKHIICLFCRVSKKLHIGTHISFLKYCLGLVIESSMTKIFRWMRSTFLFWMRSFIRHRLMPRRYIWVQHSWYVFVCSTWAFVALEFWAWAASCAFDSEVLILPFNVSLHRSGFVILGVYHPGLVIWRELLQLWCYKLGFLQSVFGHSIWAFIVRIL